MAWVAIISMIWVNIFHELLLILPLGISAADSAYNCFKFTIWATGMGERSERWNWEDSVKPLPECLHLDLDGLMESVVQHQIDIILGVLESDGSTFPFWYQLNMAKAWESEIKRVVLDFTTVWQSQCLKLAFSHLRINTLSVALLLNLCCFICNHLKFRESAIDGRVKLLNIEYAHLGTKT